jgi:hypothetical protein
MSSGSRIMYIEYKGDGLAGDARIGRVTFSKSGKSIYYRGKSFASLRGDGYKANYFDEATGENYWISGPRRDGGDTLYPGVVAIDDDVREEYWRDIRGLPDLAHLPSFKSPGKYTRRGRGTSE